MPKSEESRKRNAFALKAEQYRVRAEELGAIASEHKNEDTKSVLEGLVAEYLKMASQMDDLQGIDDRLKERPS